MTGELILEKAKDIMKLLYPQYPLEHQFSQGWLEKFKVRNGIKSFRRFGESGWVDMQDMEMKLEAIREKINQFPMKDVFNLDETGLFYRLQADHSLATKQLEGRKQDKERLKLIQKILKGYEMLSCFFPPNMTSKIQPCDARIIRAFKMPYRRRFYQNLLEGHELGLPIPKKINILDSINFAVSAWTTNVSQVSIANCFQHCKIRSNEEISSDSSETNFEESIHELENMIKDVGYRNEMSVNKLVDYSAENDECSMVQSLEEIVADILKILLMMKLKMIQYRWNQSQERRL
ncbi:UNVERIFIED_CONTAM: CENP-Bprotein 2 [Sesamum calycinum]|uniref:CENP-Bprotein 2 n=1 Tax=Sesamum calycinum TaxID=2727403 RepID=A0AAW2J849_9LAMI